MTVILAADVAGELIARTSSTARVQEIVQLSLAPAFLLAAIGAVLNVVNGRLIWIVERVDRLEHAQESGSASPEIEELPALRRRQRYAQYAINLSAAAAALICMVVALLFISAFIRTPIGSLVALCWILAMSMIVAALIYFLMETRLATTTSRELRRLSRRISEKEQEQRSRRGEEGPEQG